VLLPAAVALPVTQVAEVYEPAGGARQGLMLVLVPTAVALPATQVEAV
jgi:hypothetical protein